MNKKAETIIAMLIEILVVILVVFLVMQKAVSLAKSDSTIQINIAQDMAMMIHVLIATPGNIVLAYPNEVSKYSIFITPDRKVSVLPVKKDQSLLSKLPAMTIVRRPFNLPQGYSAEGLVEGKPHLCLEKKNRLIVLRECGSNE